MGVVVFIYVATNLSLHSNAKKMLASQFMFSRGQEISREDQARLVRWPKRLCMNCFG